LNVGTKQLIFKGMLCYNEETGDWDNEILYNKEYGTMKLSEVLELDFSELGEPPFITAGALDESPMAFGDTPLAPGEKITYQVKLTLPVTADNAYQGSAINFAVSLMAKQINPDAEYGDFECPLPALFPSSNLRNKLSQAPIRPGQNAPHVNLVSADATSVTLEFVNLAPGLAFFERRIDGVVQESGTPHPNPRPWIAEGEFQYAGTAVSSGTASQIVTFNATEKVEIRLALGGERDWDFNWTTFYVR